MTAFYMDGDYYVFRHYVPMVGHVTSETAGKRCYLSSPIFTRAKKTYDDYEVATMGVFNSRYFYNIIRLDGAIQVTPDSYSGDAVDIYSNSSGKLSLVTDYKYKNCAVHYLLGDSSEIKGYDKIMTKSFCHAGLVSAKSKYMSQGQNSNLTYAIPKPTDGGWTGGGFYGRGDNSTVYGIFPSGSNNLNCSYFHISICGVIAFNNKSDFNNFNTYMAKDRPFFLGLKCDDRGSTKYDEAIIRLCDMDFHTVKNASSVSTSVYYTASCTIALKHSTKISSTSDLRYVLNHYTSSSSVVTPCVRYGIADELKEKPEFWMSSLEYELYYCEKEITTEKNIPILYY